MSKTRLEFLAMPDEQLRWIKELLANDGIWCVVRRLPPNWQIEQVEDAGFLSNLQLKIPDEIGRLQLFFGRSDLVPTPIWRTAENGDRDIDFIRSRAIQFSPSVVVREHVLLEGQMAIMRLGYYEEAGIDPKPLRLWFRDVAKSFVKLKAAGTVIIRDTERDKS
jgi:hypothetical protein